MERSIKRFEEFTTEEKLLAILVETSESIHDLETKSYARDVLVSKLVDETDHPETDLDDAIEKLGRAN
jgi:hypothetical protein